MSLHASKYYGHQIGIKNSLGVNSVASIHSLVIEIRVNVEKYPSAVRISQITLLWEHESVTFYPTLS